LGCTRDTPIAAMRYTLDLPGMAERHRMAMVKALFRVARDEGHPLHQEIGKEKGDRLKRGRSWLATAEDIVRETCDPRDTRKDPHWVERPDEMEHFSRAVITLGRECRDQDPALVYAEVASPIYENSRPGDLVVYTDGSVQRGVRSGWGFTARSNGSIVREDCCSYSVTTSSMRMEIGAATATAALNWVQTTGYECALILTDSQSMLGKIEAGYMRPEWTRTIKASRPKKVAWIHTRGHAGVKCNERADELAGTMRVGGSLEMGVQEVLTAMAEQAGCPEGYSVERLSERGYKQGEGRHHQLEGTSRNRTNQLRTGTISLPTLRWLLKWIAEQLWVCPDC